MFPHIFNINLNINWLYGLNSESIDWLVAQ